MSMGSCLLLRDQASGRGEKRKGRLHQAAVSRWKTLRLALRHIEPFFQAQGTLRLQVAGLGVDQSLLMLQAL
jgi:hypothetical protein